MTAPGILYLVPNTLDFGIEGGADVDLQDVIPLGALRIAARLPHWVAENAKTTRAFLKRVADVVPLAQPLQGIGIVELPRPQKGARPVAASNTSSVSASLLEPLRAGHDVGLISEAGLPAVADPGALLVAAAQAAGITVMPLSGPSSLLMALSASGLNGQSFAFVGYLPVDAAARNTRIRELETLSRRLDQTQLVIETPYRNAALLTALLSQLGAETRLSISSGLTTPGGFSRTMTVAQWRKNASAPKLSAHVPAVFSLLA